VLMEAMARGSIVLAPAITGIPEIVIPEKTGFLYISESLDDFLAKIISLHNRIAVEASCAVSPLDWVRHAARVQILQNFNRRKNLIRFADQFLQRAANHMI
jgi:glycosyltransferase involved in cell wall biosynthesis